MEHRKSFFSDSRILWLKALLSGMMEHVSKDGDVVMDKYCVRISTTFSCTICRLTTRKCFLAVFTGFPTGHSSGFSFEWETHHALGANKDDSDFCTVALIDSTYVVRYRNEFFVGQGILCFIDLNLWKTWHSD